MTFFSLLLNLGVASCRSTCQPSPSPSQTLILSRCWSVSCCAAVPPSLFDRHSCALSESIIWCFRLNLLLLKLATVALTHIFRSSCSLLSRTTLAPLPRSCEHETSHAPAHRHLLKPKQLSAEILPSLADHTFEFSASPCLDFPCFCARERGKRRRLPTAGL